MKDNYNNNELTYIAERLTPSVFTTMELLEKDGIDFIDLLLSFSMIDSDKLISFHIESSEIFRLSLTTYEKILDSIGSRTFDYFYYKDVVTNKEKIKGIIENIDLRINETQSTLSQFKNADLDRLNRLCSVFSESLKIHADTDKESHEKFLKKVNECVDIIIFQHKIISKLSRYIN
jgi:hypothetical protein